MPDLISFLLPVVLNNEFSFVYAEVQAPFSVFECFRAVCELRVMINRLSILDLFFKRLSLQLKAVVDMA